MRLFCFTKLYTDAGYYMLQNWLYHALILDILVFALFSTESDTGPTSFGDILNVFWGLINVSSIGLAVTCIGAILLISG